MTYYLVGNQVVGEEDCDVEQEIRHGHYASVVDDLLQLRLPAALLLLLAPAVVVQRSHEQVQQYAVQREGVAYDDCYEHLEKNEKN